MKHKTILIVIFFILIYFHGNANSEPFIYITKWNGDNNGNIKVTLHGEDQFIKAPSIPSSGIPAEKDLDSYGYKINIDNKIYTVRMNQILDYKPTKMRSTCIGNTKSLSVTGIENCNN